MRRDLSAQTLRAGEYLLRPLAVADAGELRTLFGDPEVTEFMDIDPLSSEAEALEIVSWAQDLAARGDGLRWGVRREGRLIGTCGFNKIELDRGRRGEIAYDLERAAWGRGVMRQILPHVMAFGYGELGLHRLEAMVTLGNLRSAKLLERLGFRQEGVLREHGYWKGRFWDQMVFGRLAD